MTSGLGEKRASVTAAGVSTAVVLATAHGSGDGPAALGRWEDRTLLARTLGQLADLGVGDLHVITRPRWEPGVAAALEGAHVHASADVAGDLRLLAALARDSRAGLVVTHGDIVTHTETLAGVLADPRLYTAALTGEHERFAPAVRLRKRRVASAASPYHAVHDPDGAFLGVLKIGDGDREPVAAIAERLAGLLEPGVPPAWEEQFDRRAGIWRRSLLRAARRQARRAGVPRDRRPVELSGADEERLGRHLDALRQDAAALVLTGLVREGHGVGVVKLRELFWTRPIGDDEIAAAAGAIRTHDADRVLLDAAVKANDGFFTTFFVSPYSRYVARWAARRGFTPNQVTTVSMAIGVLAAAAFATGERWGLVAGAVLLQVAFTADCVDGQLARYTRTFSKLGAWLDSVFDRAKEYVVFAGLAIGAARAGDDVWLLAAAALALQTARHMIDFSFGDEQRDRIDTTARAPIEEPGDRPGKPVVEVEEPDDEDDVEEPPGPPRKKPLRRRALKRWRALESHPAFLWPRKMIAFPIGERFAAISLTAALFTPRTTFIVLFAWGGLAAAYNLTGRILRSIA